MIGDRPEEQLVHQAQAGDRAVLERLLRSYRPVILCWACRQGLQHADAEDVTQNSLLKAAIKLRDLKAPAAFRDWIFCIVSREFQDWLRRIKKERRGGVDISTINEAEARPPRPGPDTELLGQILELPDAKPDFVTILDALHLLPKGSERRPKAALSTPELQEAASRLIKQLQYVAPGTFRRDPAICVLRGAFLAGFLVPNRLAKDLTHSDSGRRRTLQSDFSDLKRMKRIDLPPGVPAEAVMRHVRQALDAVPEPEKQTVKTTFIKELKEMLTDEEFAAVAKHLGLQEYIE